MSRFSLARTLLASLVAVCLVGLSAQAKAETLNASKAGWYNNDNDSNTFAPGAIYFTGQIGGATYRGFMVFDIPAGAEVTEAKLRLLKGGQAGLDSQTIRLWSVESPTNNFLHEDMPYTLAADAFTDLGDSTSYGSVTVTTADTIVEVQLPAAALAHINAKRGSRFIIGFDNQTASEAGINGNYLFADTTDQVPRELILTRAPPIPTLSEWAMGGLLALLALGGATLLHRQPRASTYRQS